MNTIKRMLAATAAAGVIVVGAAGAASAHDCYNPDKKAGAGAQIVFGANDEVVYITPGLQKRIENGQVNPDDGSGFHGLIGFDEDGDGVADGTTYIVGKEAIVPAAEKDTGNPCHGITDFETFFTQCV